jgi:tetratricopeptide (TPR) repeat protein
VLRAALRRRLGDTDRAAAEISEVLTIDPLDAWGREERRRLAIRAGPSAEAQTPPETPDDQQMALDVAHDYAASGLLTDAIEPLRRLPPDGLHPMVSYTLGWLLERVGDAQADEEFRRAAALPPDHCFPARLEEIEVLRSAIAANPADARAPYYLGNLLYDRRRHRDAITAWRRAARLDPGFPTVHRNLGIAEFNVLGRERQARAAYRRALRADPSDARVLYEFDQLRRLLADPPAERLALLEHNAKLVRSRDDLTVERLNLLNRLERHQEALDILRGRRFHPWEGGEGRVSEQWVRTNLRLAQAALLEDDSARAIVCLQAALEIPHNLGEAKHPLTAENELHYHLGLAHRAAGRGSLAERWLRRGASAQGDPQAQPGAANYWRARALDALGDQAGGHTLLEELLRFTRWRAGCPQSPDYFAASLPNFMILNDDIERRNRVNCRYLESLANAGLGRRRAAIAGLREVLKHDPAHCDAAWHLNALRE